MPYDSPKQIRRRRQRAEDRPARRPRKPQALKSFTDAVWQDACAFHAGQIREHIERGHAESAGRHAEALAHMAVTRRTLEIMRALNSRDLWGSMALAKGELFNCEI